MDSMKIKVARQTTVIEEVELEYPIYSYTQEEYGETYTKITEDRFQQIKFDGFTTEITSIKSRGELNGRFLETPCSEEAWNGAVESVKSLASKL